MTEEEAKTTQCCGPQGTGRMNQYKERFCIGSECMGWRWDFVTSEDDDFTYSTEHGYCGLAGK